MLQTQASSLRLSVYALTAAGDASSLLFLLLWPNRFVSLTRVPVPCVGLSPARPKSQARTHVLELPRTTAAVFVCAGHLCRAI